jgi:hypothetical protein
MTRIARLQKLVQRWHHLRKQGHRYNAACSAALAAGGRGTDAASVTDADRARLRKQAYTWLGANLAAWTSREAKGSPADREAFRRVLNHWRSDPDLVGVRDEGHLSGLPTEERERWHRLWSDVDARLKAQP